MPKPKSKAKHGLGMASRAADFRMRLLAAYLLVMFFLLAIPLPPEMTETGSLIATIGHFMLFFGLYALAEFAHFFRADMQLLINCITLSVLLEFLQLVLPFGRTMDFFDMATNISGVLVSYTFISLAKFMVRSHK